MRTLEQYTDPATEELQLELFENDVTDKHHAMYIRREQCKHEDAKLLRRKVVIPMLIVDHKELHANVEPPIVPSRRLARVAFDLYITSQEEHPVSKFDALRSGLWEMAKKGGTGDSMGYEAWLLAENFDKQIRYMERTHYLGESELLNSEHLKECEDE